MIPAFLRIWRFRDCAHSGPSPLLQQCPHRSGERTASCRRLRISTTLASVAFTVAPLHNLDLPVGSHIPFARGVVLQDVPDWVKKETFLDYLSHHDRESVKAAKQAFVAEYEAAAIGEPDPSWKGDEPKLIQDTKAESVLLASLALWLQQPSTVCYTVVLHGLSWAGKAEKQPIIQRSEAQTPIYCHPNDVGNPFTTAHATKAAGLHQALVSVPRDNAVWTAVRALWAGLTMYSVDVRYSLFWVGLEALFGAEDNSGEISYKLAQRIAFFIAEKPEDAREIFRKAKKGYSIRSKIVHGRWKNDPAIDSGMADTEAILRTAARHLLDDPDMLKTFVSRHRDKFLEDWVFSRSTDPPPFPKC